MRIRSQKDFASGLMFVLVGLGFSFVARGYSMGTAAKMGPGYFPFLLGLVLALLGAIVTLGSLSTKGEEDQLARWDLKTLLWILGSVVLFGLLLKPLGMVLSVFVFLWVFVLLVTAPLTKRATIFSQKAVQDLSHLTWTNASIM